jgi:hypothetical protein
MADIVPRTRCAFSHSGPLDRTSLVSPAGEPSDYAGYCVVGNNLANLATGLGGAGLITWTKQPGQRLSMDSAVTA